MGECMGFFMVIFHGDLLVSNEILAISVQHFRAMCKKKAKKAESSTSAEDLPGRTIIDVIGHFLMRRMTVQQQWPLGKTITFRPNIAVMLFLEKAKSDERQAQEIDSTRFECPKCSSAGAREAILWRNIWL